jgi:tRNA (guanine-N7-)-methyltransferase
VSAEQPGAFFGRRKGKRLRTGQEELLETLLPRLRVPAEGPIDPAALLPGSASVTLEIGFGGGEHLAAEARARPDAGFIGCEPFVNGMAKLLAVIAAEGLANVRLWDRDATELLPLLPAGTIDAVYLLYPDPWPKRRQRKRRFISDETLRAFARIMRPGAELRFATDIDDYAGWALAHVPTIQRLRMDRAACRQLAPTVGTMARNPLRSEGDARGPPARLPHLSPALRWPSRV